MKLCLLLALSVLAAAQSTTTRYETDINGRRVEMTSSGKSDGTTTEKQRSMNGQEVPTEQVEEKTISESPNGKIVERTVRRYSPTGGLSSTDRVRIEEEKTAGGGSTRRETTWRSDINGRMNEIERRVAETKVSGASSTTETSVIRPDINGAFETAEKRVKVTEKNGNTEQTNESVQRPGSDGRLHEQIREVSTTTKAGDKTTEQKSTYEPGINGQLELASQSVTSSVKRPDGSQVTEVNLYAKSGEGRGQEGGIGPQIKEQQIIERTKAADGSTVETLSVRRPNLNEPDKLGSPRKLSETVCTGNCQPSDK